MKTDDGQNGENCEPSLASPKEKTLSQVEQCFGVQVFENHIGVLRSTLWCAGQFSEDDGDFLSQLQ